MALPFIEIIEWVEHSPNLLMYKFADADKEIKNGAQLTVRESQTALLLNEGQLADTFSAGRHKLSTENIPILSRLKGWKYGFESPFKADVYFFSTKQFVNLKWGTPAPIIMPDLQLGQVRVRAFGTYNIRIVDVAKFFFQYAGTYPQLSIMELEFQLRDYIAPKFGEVLSQAKIPVIEVAGNLSALSSKIQPLIQPYFSEFGIEITQFAISSATLPEEVTAHFDKITNMNMVQDMDKFQQFNMANAVGQQGTGLNAGVQQGAMVGAMMNAMNQMNQQKTQPAEDITTKLQKLKSLFDTGLIDEADYKTKKEELLKQL
jgi:membrane protease subunit (stomatin/prohibitin family)